MKKIISLMLAIVLLVGMVPIAAVADETPTQTPITYLDKHGNEQTCEDYTVLTSGGLLTKLTPGWYVVEEDTTIDNILDDGKGDFNLILCDDAELKMEKFENTQGGLNIYAQKKGTGKLTIQTVEYGGIIMQGAVTINGGTVDVTLESGRNGLISMMGISGTSVTINNATVKAFADTPNDKNWYQIESLGIRATSGDVVIKNSTVTATASEVVVNDKTCLSHGIYSQNGNVRIFNSTVTAAGGKANDDSRSESCGIYANGNIDIEDSTVVASADTNSTNYNALRANGGEIHCENADLEFTSSQNMKLTGSFEKVTVTESSVGLNEYLEDGYAFYDADGNVKNANAAKLENVSIAEHEHNFNTRETDVYYCSCGKFDTTQSVAYVDYVDGEAVTKYTTDYEVVTNATTQWQPGKTYVVNSTVTIDGTVQNGSGTGEIKLILCDGAELKVNSGIYITETSFTIYGQEKGTGKLTTTAANGYSAGIYVFNGILTINGGVINTTGGNDDVGSYGIWSNKRSSYLKPVKLIINGGDVTAIGNKVVPDPSFPEIAPTSYGIKAEDLEINGGTVTAGSNELQKPAYGIYTSSATTITGGEITLNTQGKLNNPTISGGEFKGTSMLVLAGDAENIELSGGNFEMTVHTESTAFDAIVADGYALFDKDDNFVNMGDTDINIEGNFAIIKEHTCKFTQNSITGRYTCQCGRVTRTKPISYIDENGNTKWCLDYGDVSSGFVDDDITPASGETAWWVFDENNTRNTRVEIKAAYINDTTLNIILCDGVEVNFTEGILLDGNSNYSAHLNIYAQSTGDKAGKLTIDKGIKTSTSYNSSMTVNGGNITVTSSYDNSNRAIRSGDFTMNGGTLTTNSESNGINAKYSATVNGGTLNANSTTDGTIIAIYTEGDLTITGGTFNLGNNKIKATNSLIISTSDFTIPKYSELGSLEISGDVTLKSLLPSGCAFMQNEKYYIGNIGFDWENIGFVPLNSKTPLERSWADEEYEYEVLECDEHSGSPCAYCGYKKKVNSGNSEPTLTPTVTQPATGGKIEISNTSPTAGEVIKVTPKADDGYVVDKIIVKDASGNTIEVTKNSDGSYSFTQPDTEVTVEVSFKPMASFKDVKSGDWYESAVNFVVANGIMNGVSENYFYPNYKITRGMFATVLYNLAGKPEVEIKNTYSDVKASEYYAAPIAWATEMGIVNGMPSGKFLPNEPITREQMVKMLWVYLGKPEATSDLSRFPDGNKVSDYAQTAMAWAVESGVITGRANGTLDPRGTATRAEAAKIFMNYLDK